MRPTLPLLTTLLMVLCVSATGQNVFNPADPIVRHSKTQPLGSAANPDPNKMGLQKWVSTITNGISTGNGAWDASSYKAYFAKLTSTKGIAFRLKFPRSYNNPDSAGKKYPMMLFFHGAGESGCNTNGGVYNNEKQLALGGNSYRLKVDRNQFDGFLLYPQMVPTDGSCWGNWGTNVSVYYSTIASLLDSMAKYIRVDENKVVANGLSAGGTASWKMAEFFPQKIAAILPAAAAGLKQNFPLFVHIPVWLATGGKDTAPSPAQAQYNVNQVTNIGGYIKYTLYPDLGHAVWARHWAEAGYLDWLNNSHKANPLVFFGRNEFCPDSVINARLGITQGFYAYEWQWNNSTIATRTNGVNTIQNSSVVSSFTGNEIIVKAFGTYRVRFKRLASSAWTVWSPIPAVIKTKGVTNSPNIEINGNYSKVLPSLDGRTTVPLTLPDGYAKYEYYRASDNVLVSSSQNFAAPVGSYKAKVYEKYGCGSNFSPVFTVVPASGTPKPDPAANLTAAPAPGNKIQLNWTDKAGPTYDETGFEIYRAINPNGPYVFVGINPANNRSYTDTGLKENTLYYYVVRSVNNTGAAATSNQAISKTLEDDIPPTAPVLFYQGATLNSVSLAWHPSIDNAAIKRYDIYVDGKKLYSSRTNSFTVAGLDSLKYYSFTVKGIDTVGNESPFSNQIAGFTHRQGVSYKYYNGVWTKLPDFNALTPVKTGISDTVRGNLSVRTQTDNYGFLYTGYIYIPETSTYTFETYSDEGSKLIIGNYSYTATPVVQNDSVHTGRLRTGQINLTRGYHPIAIPYFEKTGTEKLELYFSNSSGRARQRILEGFFTTVPYNLPAAPATPGSFTGTGISSSKIRLNWADLSSNETGFEVLRSLTATGPFVNVATTPANSTFYVDTLLKASTRYYYRLRSVSQSGESGFVSTNALTSAPASTPNPDAPSHLVALSPVAGKVSLSWNDNSTNETGFQIWRSTNGTSFTMIATAAANSNAYADNSVSNLVKYYYYVVAVNGTYASPKTNTATVTPGNTAPVISNPGDLIVKSGTTLTPTVTITDNAGDVVTAKLIDAPRFVTITYLSGSSYLLNINPTQQDIGNYSFTIIATDDKGNESNRPINLDVSDKNTRSVLVRLGRSVPGLPTNWNLWTGLLAANATKTGLIDEQRAATNFSITTVKAWPKYNDIGFVSGDNSGLYPDKIMERGVSTTDSLQTLIFNGLNPSMRYNLSFMSSRNEGSDASIEFISGTQKKILNARYNNQETANLNGLIPNSSGQIAVNIRKLNAKVTMHLNVIKIEEYSPAIVIHNPVNLYAEASDRTVVNLSWIDRASNENASLGYEVERSSDSLFSSKTLYRLNANVTNYKVVGLAAGTKYWFRVRAKTGTTYSEYSNKAFVITPEEVVNVNFNYTVTNGPTYWNNMATMPTNPATINGLKNSLKVVTPLSVSIEDVFNGEFNAGQITGNNSGVVPDNVLLSSYWLDRGQVSTMRLTGLNHGVQYSIGFFGSSGPAGWYLGDYTATYTINDKTVYLNSWENTSKIVFINDVLPDENGELLIKFSTTAVAAYGFNAGMVIYSRAASTGSSSGVTSEAPPQQDQIMLRDSPSIVSKTSMYPNPFRDNIVIEFFNESTSDHISTEVYDQSGRVLQTRQYNSLPQGFNRLQINASGLTNTTQLYFIALKVNGKVKSINKMMKRN